MNAYNFPTLLQNQCKETKCTLDSNKEHKEKQNQISSSEDRKEWETKIGRKGFHTGCGGFGSHNDQEGMPKLVYEYLRAHPTSSTLLCSLVCI